MCWLREARTSLSVDFLVGFEIEFIIFKSTRPVEAVSNQGWTTANAFLSGNIAAVVVEEIANAIQESGIELQMFHAEAAPVQVRVYR